MEANYLRLHKRIVAVANEASKKKDCAESKADILSQIEAHSRRIMSLREELNKIREFT